MTDPAALPEEEFDAGATFAERRAQPASEAAETPMTTITIPRINSRERLMARGL